MTIVLVQITSQSPRINKYLMAYNHYLSNKVKNNRRKKALQSKPPSRPWILGSRGVPKWKTLWRGKLKKINSGKSIMSILEEIWKARTKISTNPNTRLAALEEISSTVISTLRIHILAKGEERKAKRSKERSKEKANRGLGEDLER